MAELPTELFPKDFQGGLYAGEANSPTGLNKPFWAKITAYDGAKFYSWTEQRQTSTGFSNLPGGRTGTASTMPAIEPNGANLSSQIPFFARIQRSYFDTNKKSFVYTMVGGEAGITTGGGGFTPTGCGAYVNDNGANNLTTGGNFKMVWAFPPVDDTGSPSLFFNGVDSFIASNPSPQDHIFGATLSFIQSGAATTNGEEIVTGVIRRNSVNLLGQSFSPGFGPAGQSFIVAMSGRYKLVKNDILDVVVFQTINPDPGNPSWAVSGSFWIERLET